MALTKNVFTVLKMFASTNEKLNQRQLSEATKLSLGTVNTAVKSLENRGLIKDRMITQKGLEALKPYAVDNAIIMAAGLSSRFAPISYEKPKGVLKVRGEVLIERQIRQLMEAGITDITVVVGYKKEYFFYLAGKFGVSIVVNPDYATRNNNSTLWYVKNRLGNTYICSSDDYFTVNPFEHYVYDAYYSATYVAGPTKEWCLKEGPGGRITGVEIGGFDAWVMLGHVYFDRAFSKRFVEILESVYERPETADKLWEDIYADHIKQLSMTIRKYPDGVINEFDSLDELREFDPAFIENIDSEIFDNIVSVLHCEKSDIHDFYPLKQGLTNLSAHFTVGFGKSAQEYVYRHPGVGTEKLVDRAGEEAGLRLARELGLDSTFIYEDQKEGWKISHFVKDAKNLDPHNPEQLRRAMEMGRTLHESGAVLDRHFSFVDEGLNYEKVLKEHGPIEVPGYFELREKILKLKAYADADHAKTVISHNDFFSLNFLIDENDTYSLIDWEYAGMSDEANDFGTFAVCCELSEDEANKAIDYYFGRAATTKERRHFWSYVVFAGWCWYLWSLVKEAEGENVGEWFFIYYRYAAQYIDKLLSWYEED
ncbi:NTP transferase domain-containing protein [Lancefieldella rimae]|uniref:NTP transferase domain-containing protein n=1 Tax=Lancefieldella rimae TaxID=1383 RepID=UPI001CB47842|nr:NTP transferase domain-containing protein [Lancefieldella rimae]MBF4804247.1 NTP transferase domain-containing protein [Lancefieldella rimae]